MPEVMIPTGADDAQPTQKQGEKAPDPQRPEWLDPKFKNVEEQAKAYAEAQKLIGQKSTEGSKTPEQTLTEAKVDLTALNKELAEKGSLSPETYTKLAAAGIPKEMADGYVAGLVAKANEKAGRFEALAGGKEQLKQVQEWAGANLTKKEIDAFNSLLSGPNQNLDAAELAMKSIVQAYKADTGSEPTFVAGDRIVANNDGVEPFTSDEQVTAVMATREYREDPAVRAKVMKRLAKSPGVLEPQRGQ